MSRQKIHMGDGTLLVIGWDEPFQTWYAIYYDDVDEDAPPRVAIGYHPAEQDILRAERPDAIIGPYPVRDDELETMLTQMIPNLMGIEPEAKQDGCMFCGQPPWQPNPNCPDHPFDRLRNS